MRETLVRALTLIGKSAVNRDNPQGTPTEAEIAWLAGILEGEGTVMLGAWVRNGSNAVVAGSIAPGALKISVNIKFYNTDAGIIAKVVDILDRLGIGYHVKEREMKPMLKPGGEGVYSPTAPMLTVTISVMPVAYTLAKLLRPWCFGEKGARLDLIIQYLARRFARAEAAGKTRTEYDVNDLRIVNSFYARFARRPDNNAHLLARLLNEHERSAA